MTEEGWRGIERLDLYDCDFEIQKGHKLQVVFANRVMVKIFNFKTDEKHDLKDISELVPVRHIKFISVTIMAFILWLTSICAFLYFPVRGVQFTWTLWTLPLVYGAWIFKNMHLRKKRKREIDRSRMEVEYVFKQGQKHF